MLHYTMRPVGKLKSRKAASIRVAPGDTLEWRNPNTGGHYPDLTVLSVNKTTGAALVKGIRDRLTPETFNVRLDQVTVTKRAGE